MESIPAIPPTLTGKRLLIVEDDWLLQNLLSSRLAPLRERGIEVAPVFDGTKAVESATEHRPDIILLDLLLPGMSGFEFLETLQKQDPTFRNIPVIIFTNLNGDTDREHAEKLGVRAYMHKSDCTMEEIIDKLELYLGESK